ncbi:unnamed protein product [Meloidogyne enterolobii]|uniref:Uncharacterized protein n=1 Tax=Meloidogyne enterolobii TaxID=390850 RepID=A0ACB0ZL70_MELEN
MFYSSDHFNLFLPFIHTQANVKRITSFGSSLWIMRSCPSTSLNSTITQL